MKLLQLGSRSAAVKKWHYFLIGQGLYHGSAHGIFDWATHTATIAFQKKQGLVPDGVVGNLTVAAAMLLGFGVVVDVRNDTSGANYPSKPDFPPLVTNAEREALFGKIAFKATPLPNNPEHFDITNRWDRDNLVTVTVPQLIPLKGSATVYFHKKGAKQLKQLWSDWQKAGLLPLVLTWDGGYNPRFVRGSQTVLSNHAFGTAFDINFAWNKLGTVPALMGQKGSVRQLVAIAHKNGFYWGGHFTRKDGMHFELAKIIKL
ncbi:M15 family metallopeptidase [Flavobacterium paronense]|uniref:M15 family metallopeptidase n=1 Tax=Flavobacterium paronense TaxID=1392775 RepID=A0ABV5GCP3_9FLAO|nr:M15 family metallopeptidase [Flavobacterium paronense]MDN3676280.1 M15 family metallopeptidase [Flavobacterium paronense]